MFVFMFGEIIYLSFSSQISNHISSFSVSAHLKTEEEALDYQMGGAKNNINSYIDNSMDSSYSSSFDDTKNSYQQDDTSNILEVILNIIVEIVKFVA